MVATAEEIHQFIIMIIITEEVTWDSRVGLQALDIIIDSVGTYHQEGHQDGKARQARKVIGRMKIRRTSFPTISIILLLRMIP